MSTKTGRFRKRQTMETLERVTSNRRVRRTAVTVAILLLLIAVTGFVVLPPVLKPYFMEKLSGALHHDVSIGRIRVNPFALSLEIEKLHIKDRTKKGTLFSADSIYLNLESISVFKQGVVLSEVRIDKPYVNIEVTGFREGNFSDLLVQDLPKLRAELRPYKFSINNISITRGSIDYFDGPKGMGHLIRDMTLTIPFISNLPYHTETAVSPLFQATVNGDPVSFRGTTKLFSDSLETHLDLKISGLDIPYYLAYLPVEMDIEIASCVLDTDLKIAYTQYKDKRPSLSVSGEVKLQKIRLRERQGAPLLDLGEISLSIASSDVIGNKAYLSRVIVKSPEVWISRDREGKTNLERLGLITPRAQAGTRLSSGTEAGSGNTNALTLTVDELSVEEGKATLSDSTVNGDFRTRLGSFQLKAEGLTTEPGRSATMVLSFSTESDEAVKLEAAFSLDPLVVEGAAEVRRLAIGKYGPYASRYTPATVTGRADMTSRFKVTKTGTDLQASLSEFRLDVASLVVKKHGEAEELLKVPALGVREGTLDLGKREIVLGEVSSRGGAGYLKRLKDGSFSLEGLVKGSAEPPQPPGAEGNRPWSVTIRRVDLDQYSLKAVDTAPTEPVQFVLDRLRFTGEGLSTAGDHKGTVSLACRINRRGGLHVSGSLGMNPVAAEMTVGLKDFDLTDLQPYLDGRVKLIVVDGRLSSQGKMSAAYSAEAGPRVVYRGDLLVADFFSIDSINADDLLKWKSLHLGGVDLRYGPAQLTVREVALADFYSRLVINADGSLNVQEIVAAESGRDEAQSPPSVAGVRAAELAGEIRRRIEIQQVTVQGGTIDFRDYFIKPNYAVRLLEIGGRVSGLSSAEDSAADLELRGKVDNYAPVEISGKINPFGKDLLLDLTGTFKNVELSPVTPYAGKYLGYTVEKGKLTVNVEYRVVKNKLDAKNSVFLDQFTLGDRVESPTATKLPVKLAIALLKNRRGEISLDVPVSGSIDDPKFSLGAVILKILVNILVKAATSPFALLGAIFGGGEQLSYVEFDYGSGRVSDESARKLDSLVKALDDRPGLIMDVIGHADREKDADGLRQLHFERKVKAQKLKDQVRHEQPARSVDEVEIEADEYPKYLKMAYKEERFPKPRTFLGIPKDLPVAEMEKLMLTHLEIRDEDLKALASQRSKAVRDYILQGGTVDAARVFLVEPKSLEPEDKEGAKKSRVDFKLR